MIYPPPQVQQKLWGYVRQPDDDPDLVAVLESISAGTVAFGHFHTVFQRRWRNLNLVDVAGCSLPGIDGDPRARYTVFTWNQKEWWVENHKVDYDYMSELEAVRVSNMPGKAFFLNYFDLEKPGRS